MPMAQGALEGIIKDSDHGRISTSTWINEPGTHECAAGHYKKKGPQNLLAEWKVMGPSMVF